MKYYVLKFLMVPIVSVRTVVLGIEKLYLRARIAKGAKACSGRIYINGRGVITGLSGVSIEDNVHIGNNFYIRGEGGLIIGENTHISRNIVIYTINHDYKGKRLPYDENFRENPVSIGRNVWIGTNVVVLPGTTIGDGAIIGAGAVIHGDIPSLAIVGAGQFNEIGKRDQDHYEHLNSHKQFGGVNGSMIDERR